jgi:hypothetical protein
MARYTASARSAGAGSTTLPLASLYSPTSTSGAVREVGVFNTTSTAVAVGVARLTTQGTPGTGLTETKHNDRSVAAAITGFQTHSGGPTISDEFCRTVLGAAVGAGVIWTFGDTGLLIPAGTANGIGIIVTTGTGQVVDFYFVWDE